MAAITSTNEESRITAGNSSATTGTWRVESYSLILTDNAGKIFRGIAFPYDDDLTPGKNGAKRLFFAGTM